MLCLHASARSSLPLRPLLCTMQYARDLYGFAPEPIDHYVGQAGDHKLARPAHAALASHLGKILQPLNLQLDLIAHLDRGRRFVLRDVILDGVGVMLRVPRPNEPHTRLSMMPRASPAPPDASPTARHAPLRSRRRRNSVV